jgi:3-methyladenine DNA glycosylase AlkD
MYDEIKKAFYYCENKEDGMGMSSYLKNKFPCLGIKKPERVKLQKVFISESKKIKEIDWDLIFKLWKLPEREFQYLAIDLLVANVKCLEKSDIKNIEKLITTKSWWDTVDIMATKLVGHICKEYPELIEEVVLNWSKDDNLWLSRTAILFQLKYKEETNTKLLSRIIMENKDTKEFFLNKAIGWILREYSKTNVNWVRSFIAENELSKISAREGSKYL